MRVRVQRCDITKTQRLLRDWPKQTYLRYTECCPVAQAIRRTKRKKVLIGYWNALVAGKSYALPEEVGTFIRAFDMGKAVKPFEFEMKPLKESELS